MTLRPFVDDAATLTIGGLTVENGRDRVALYGSLDLSRDKAGLADARALLALLTRAVAALEAEPSLPDATAGPAAAKIVRNPFA